MGKGKEALASFSMDDHITPNTESEFYPKYNKNSLKRAIEEHNIALYTFVKGYFSSYNI